MSRLRTLTFVEDDEAQMPGETPSDAAMLRHHQVNWVAVESIMGIYVVHIRVSSLS